MNLSKSRDAQREEVIERVRPLLPRVAARAGETERNRRVSTETIKELKALGLFNLLLPRQLDGGGADFSTFSLITKLLATACGSTAWVYAVITESNWIAALFPKEAQEEVWGESFSPLVCASIIPFGKAEKATGGYLLDGRWQYLSGSEHSDWVILSAATDDPLSGSSVIDALVRRSEITVLDDWRVLGLAGTSTNSAIVTKLFVPAHRCIAHSSLLDGTAPGGQLFLDYPLGKVPRALVASFSLSPVIVGLASKGLELCAAAIEEQSRKPLPPDWSQVQSRFAEAVMNVELANSILETYGVRNDALARSSKEISDLLGAHSKLGAAHMIKLCKRSVELLSEISGSRWLYNAHPLQRIVRDATAASTHRSANWDLVSQTYVNAMLRARKAT